MNLADELQKLQALRDAGTLTEDEFAKAKARVLDGREPVQSAAPRSSLHQLVRSQDDRWVAGVAGGLGAMTGLPTWSWRILFVLTGLLHGLGVLMYVLLWIFVPLAVPASRRLTAPRDAN